jgi:hypothetical protein
MLKCLLYGWKLACLTGLINYQSASPDVQFSI